MDVVVLRYTSLSQNVPIYVMVIQKMHDASGWPTIFHPYLLNH